MARLVYVLPGLFGSQLSAPDVFGVRRELWADPLRLSIGGAYEMRLAADGLAPGPPDGRLCLPLLPLPAYYGALSAHLRAVGPQYGWEVREGGYDWRLSQAVSGNLLANAVRAEVTPDEPCYMVCHSNGGLVARLAYSQLLATGQQGLIQRILTLGTPHGGSYAWPLALGEADVTLQGLLLLQSTISGTLYSPFSPIQVVGYDLAGLLRLTATWPSMYGCLPPLQGDWQATDPNRAALYDADNWPAGQGVSQLHLDTAREVVHPLLAGPTTRPPAGRLVTVSSQSMPTRVRLDYPPQLGRPGAFSTFALGDGTVPSANARLAGYHNVNWQGEHQDLARNAALIQAIPSLLLDEEPAPDLPAHSTPQSPPLPFGRVTFAPLPIRDG